MIYDSSTQNHTATKPIIESQIMLLVLIFRCIGQGKPLCFIGPCIWLSQKCNVSYILLYNYAHSGAFDMQGRETRYVSLSLALAYG